MWLTEIQNKVSHYPLPNPIVFEFIASASTPLSVPNNLSFYIIRSLRRIPEKRIIIEQRVEHLQCRFFEVNIQTQVDKVYITAVHTALQK